MKMSTPENKVYRFVSIIPLAVPLILAAEGTIRGENIRIGISYSSSQGRANEVISSVSCAFVTVAHIFCFVVTSRTKGHPVANFRSSAMTKGKGSHHHHGKSKGAAHAVPPVDELVRFINEGDDGKTGVTVAQIEKAMSTLADQVHTATSQSQHHQQQQPPQPQQVARSARQMPSEEELKAHFQAQKALEHQRWLASQYRNVEVPLPKQYTEWTNVGRNRYVRFEQFDRSNEKMSLIVNLYFQELSEPYSSFTYQFFVFGWPDLCILAYGKEVDDDKAPPPSASETGEFVGAIVSRVSRKGPLAPLRGYIAMLAVAKHFRGCRIGSSLVEASVSLMKAKRCDEVSLETPTSNARALKLYTDLGFAKIKFLPSYYLDGMDAFRLKLYLVDYMARFSHEDDGAALEAAAAAPAAEAQAGSTANSNE